MPPDAPRTMTVNDRPMVKALVLAGMAEHWGVVDPSVNGDLDDLPNAHPGSRTVVIERDAIVVATGTIVPRDDNSAEIVRTSVSTNVRGEGLGRQVVDELVATGRDWGIERIFLETNSDWLGPIAFWQACGLRITHRAPGPFGDETWFELVL